MAKDLTPAPCGAQGLRIGCPNYDPLAGVPVGTSEVSTGKTRGEHGENTGVRPRPRDPNTGVARPPTRGPHGVSTGEARVPRPKKFWRISKKPGSRPGRREGGWRERLAIPRDPALGGVL